MADEAAAVVIVTPNESNSPPAAENPSNSAPAEEVVVAAAAASAAASQQVGLELGQILAAVQAQSAQISEIAARQGTLEAKLNEVCNLVDEAGRLLQEMEVEDNSIPVENPGKVTEVEVPNPITSNPSNEPAPQTPKSGWRKLLLGA